MWATAAAGSIAYWQGDPAHARIRYGQQLELARGLDSERGMVDALFNLGHVAFIDGRRACHSAGRVGRDPTALPRPR